MPYTYLIGWTDIDKYYYGVRFAPGCVPSDLFTTYFTSSKRVHKLHEQVGRPDVIEVRRTFVSSTKAINWERKVLQRLDIGDGHRWLNRNVSGAILHTEDVRQKISEAKRGKPAHNKGKPCSEEQKAKISQTRKQRNLGEKSAQYLPAHPGNSNPMRNPMVVEAYKKRITGRKRKYRADGSWFWHYPEKATASEDAVG